MAFCCGETLYDPEGSNLDRVLNEKIEKENASKQNETKLLLLGAGESGKSTVAKQLKILYLAGYTEDDRKEYIVDIHLNLYQVMRTLLEACVSFQIPINPKYSGLLSQFENELIDRVTPEMAADIMTLWDDEGIQLAYKRRNEFQLADSAEYYCTAADRIAHKEYLPTDQDILRVRTRTTGIKETVFVVDNHVFRLIDVGGQRSERKKWMHCFEGVDACLFCVALSGFNQTLWEDRKTNRMHEALKLFHEICTSKWFTRTALMLFLNKSDIFKEKIDQGHSITCCFQDYDGANTFDESVAFIQDKFTTVFDPQTRRPIHVYPHITCATSTDNIKLVFDVVRDFIVRSVIQTAGNY